MIIYEKEQRHLVRNDFRLWYKKLHCISIFCCKCCAVLQSHIGCSCCYQTRTSFYRFRSIMFFPFPKRNRHICNIFDTNGVFYILPQTIYGVQFGTGLWPIVKDWWSYLFCQPCRGLRIIISLKLPNNSRREH